MAATLESSVLQRAAEVLGGKAKLRERLRVPMRELERWLGGEAQAPTDIFLRAVDIVASAQAEEISGRLAAAKQRAQDLGERAAQAQERARRLQEHSRQLVADVRARIVASRSARDGRAREAAELLSAALDAALAATDAGKGNNLQLLCPDGLRIVTHRGFGQPFLEFFAVVEHGNYSCGAALDAARPVVIPDVASHPLFAGNAGGRMLIESGVRACQSTPIVGSSGEVLGMLNTHFEDPREPREAQLAAVGAIAHHAAAWLEQTLV